MPIHIKEIAKYKLYQINDKYIMYHSSAEKWVSSEPLEAHELEVWNSYKESIATMP